MQRALWDCTVSNIRRQVKLLVHLVIHFNIDGVLSLFLCVTDFSHCIILEIEETVLGPNPACSDHWQVLAIYWLVVRIHWFTKTQFASLEEVRVGETNPSQCNKS